MREPGTRGEAKIKVALIRPEDMLLTNVVHGVYGPYGPTGQGGVYTIMFGDPGEPFPRELPADADERSKAMNQQAEEYWNGKGGHVFLITPQELDYAIAKMQEAGINTKVAEVYKNKFEHNPVSPIVEETHSQPAKNAIHLGKVSLKPKTQQNIGRKSGMSM